MKTLLSLLAACCLLSAYCFSQETEEEAIPFKFVEAEINSASFQETADPQAVSLKVNVPLGDSYTLRADLTGASSAGNYFTLGVSGKKKLGENFAFRLNFGAGWLLGDEDPFCADAGLLLVQKLGDVTYLLLEGQIKSNGQKVWYTTRLNWQILGAVGLGVRAQKNSLVGPYFQVGHDNFGCLWFGAGVKEDKKKDFCIAGGVKIVF